MNFHFARSAFGMAFYVTLLRCLQGVCLVVLIRYRSLILVPIHLQTDSRPTGNTINMFGSSHSQPCKTSITYSLGSFCPFLKLFSHRFVSAPDNRTRNPYLDAQSLVGTDTLLRWFLRGFGSWGCCCWSNSKGIP